MATVHIGNVYSRISDISARGIKAVNAALCAITPGHQFTPLYKKGLWDGYTRFYRIQGNKFPTGLLTKVVKTLMTIGETCDIEDERVTMDADVPESISLFHEELGTITLRDYQHDAVVKAIEATRGIINIATNGGKTEVACGIIKCILPSLKKGQTIGFFTHSQEIFYQTHKRISERLGMEIGLIGDGVWDERQINLIMIPTVCRYLTEPVELPKTRKKTALLTKMKGADKDVQKELRKQITQIEEEERADYKDKVARTANMLGNMVTYIADEVHHASSASWYDLFMSLDKAFFRFGLTGTVDQADEINTNRLYGCTGKITTKISNQYLIDHGYSAKPTIFLIKYSTPRLPNGEYRDIYEAGIIHNDARNTAFVGQIVKRANSGSQCLIMVAETSHGEAVRGMIIDQGIEPLFIHGQKTSKYRANALDEFKKGQSSILIATTILDEGVDMSGINCLFLMGGGKSMKKLLQRIGRGVRKKADGSGVEVYDGVDEHNTMLKWHYKERCDTYKAEGFDIVYKNSRED